MAATDMLVKRARWVAAGRTHDVPSPCTSVCRMSPTTELCLGCFRTLDEIALWGRMDDVAKRAVWQSISGRLQQAADTSI
jgi:predicted Fe-S protein YdhL (DUF1289 family)